jgi:hypothetical protein
VDVHRALRDDVWRLGVHQVEDSMDRLVAPYAEDASAQKPAALAVDENFHEALRLALFDGAAYILHSHLRHRSRLPGFSHLCLGHSHATKRRIGAEIVSEDAVADTAWIVVEQICGHNLEIVPGRVGERATAVAITQRPDARYVGAQLSSTSMKPRLSVVSPPTSIKMRGASSNLPATATSRRDTKRGSPTKTQIF